MKIEEAKKIPIRLLVERLGGTFVRKKGNDLWYLSPFRPERTASFKVDEKTNKFKDFADPRGQGDIVDLYCDYHNKSRKDREAISQALKALEDLATVEQKFISTKVSLVKYSERYQIKKRSPRIKAQGLVDEVNRRNLPLKLVSEYMPEMLVHDTERDVKFNAFGMENDYEGVEICAYYPKKEKPFDKFKNCIGPKGLTTYRGSADDVTAFVFSSKWDCLTWLHLHGQQKDEEMIVYHGDSIVHACAEYIMLRPEISRVVHFKHMDQPGIVADAELALLLEAAPIAYGTVEHLYAGHKDLSESFSSDPQAVRAAIKNGLAPTNTNHPLMRTGGQPKNRL